MTDSGFCSRFEWAKAILELTSQEEEKPQIQIKPAKSSDFPTQAERPMKSYLNCKKFEDSFNLKLPPWEISLNLAMHE